MNRNSTLRQSISLVKRRMSRVLPIGKTETKPLETTKELFKDFSEHTTLLGVSQVLRKRNLFWIIAYGFCLVMSVVQSWGVARQFFEETTTQRFLIINKRMLPFPSVTICSNVLLPEKYDMSSIPNYNTAELADETCTNTENDTLDDIVEYNSEAVIKFLRYNKTEADRIGLSSKIIDEFLTYCQFDMSRCNYSNPDEIFIFNSPAYGNCFTINPALNGKKGAEVDLNGYLRLVLAISGGYRMYHQPPVALIYLHSAGTAPILDSPEAILIESGMSVKIAIKLVERVFYRKRLWTNGMPTCIADDEEPYQKSSRYYHDTTPYLYSLSACLKSCDQDYLVHPPCSTIDHSLPIREENIELERNLSIQLPRNTCEEFSSQNCKCPIPCRILRYDVYFDSTQVRNMGCSNSNLTGDVAKNKTRVKIAFFASAYESIQEELKHSLTEFLGILGGNMSLWIGLCFLSVLELVELSWNLLRVWPNERKLKASPKKKPRPFFLSNPTDRLYAFSATSRNFKTQNMNVFPRRVY